MFNVQVGNCNQQVMRTFGWSPSEGELQELVGEIDQVLLFNNIIPVQLSTPPFSLWDLWLCLKIRFFAKGWKWLYHLQWICLAYDQVKNEYYHALILKLRVIDGMC